MVSGGLAVLFLLLCVGIIILLTSRYKVNAFVVLIGVAFLFGLLVGMPLDSIVKFIRAGFGGTLGYIGIVIVAGTIIGVILEKTGAALSMTRSILKLVGKERSPLAMSIAGYVVSIPVFCDSGYVILTPLNKALARETGKSMAVMAVALATGLYATHCLVPPTPGPIAAAGILGADLGRVIAFGVAVSIPGMIAGYLWAIHFAKRYTVDLGEAESYESLVKKFGDLPGGLHAFMPILIPIGLILLKSIAAYPTKPFGEGTLANFLTFIGDPVTALMLGILIALTLVKKEMMGEAVSDWMSKGVKDAALILAITGAGGAFGKILKSSPLADYLGTTLSTMNIGILLPFIIAAAIKTAQGSSTVAIITTASIMAPLMSGLGLDPAFTVLAIGAGAMTVSHANDSYFWVVSQFSNMDVPVAYRAYTSATFVLGTVSIICVAALSVIF
ncbi:GntP family permease [Maridesulfovibrio hydrothermalis]|uniref:Gluconate transporter n=1 Tax=Maridesulfovibrio hydrothermalis AM13 = DSM 14728 TaxID=1121451 RepID=L0R8A2_9BACT|nr:GntP family permease [Maridesulfovibrio hydrothermalis]CCO22974.1 Gluconate transporter [Maridesulfovibrio hydrothermalis AM13 = DSM 14728]